MGYTPVFDTVFDGTLCGRWPTLPVWLTILPLADRHGHIDITYQAIAARTGWPIELLKQGIADLMAPDPDSRTDENEGRRLKLIDEARSWGWVVINHTKYREKARKAAYDAARTEDGRNRERMAERTRDDPRPPAMSRADPPSNTNTNTDSNKNKNQEGLPDGLNPEAWTLWNGYRKFKPASLHLAMKNLSKFGADQMAVVEQSIGNEWKGLFPIDRKKQVRKWE